MASALLPKLEKTRSEVEELLFEVVTLEVGAACFLLLCRPAVSACSLSFSAAGWQVAAFSGLARLGH